LNFKDFIKSEGLKKLALAKLKSASYSLLIYLFNEILSGVDEIISSRKELSILLGWPEKQITEGLDELKFCNMIQVTEVAGKPLRIRPQLHLDQWNIPHVLPSDQKKQPLGEAINLHSLVPTDNPIPFPKNFKVTSANTNANDSTSPEKTLNDLNAFREKHEGIDAKIKALAVEELDTIKHEKRMITPDEELLLQILSQHQQPKKQLLMALHSSLVYPNLKFFLATAKLYAEIQDPNKK
jgi:hypothetical protein